MDSQDTWVLLIYEPYCKHCEAFEPEFKKAALSLEGQVKFGKIDGIQHAQFVKMFDLKFFPAVVGFPQGPRRDDKGV